MSGDSKDAQQVPDTPVVSLIEWSRKRSITNVAAHLNRMAGHIARAETVTEPTGFVLALVEPDGKTEVLWAGLTTTNIEPAREAIGDRLHAAGAKARLNSLKAAKVNADG